MNRELPRISPPYGGVRGRLGNDIGLASGVGVGSRAGVPRVCSERARSPRPLHDAAVAKVGERFRDVTLRDGFLAGESVIGERLQFASSFVRMLPRDFGDEPLFRWSRRPPPQEVIST